MTTSLHSSLEDVRALVADAVGVPAHEIADNDDLVSLGLDSLRLLNLTNLWRKEGIKVHFSTLVLEPTVAAIAATLDAADRRPPKKKPVPQEPSASTDESFGLATMQHAYWIGRDSEQSLGGVAAHLYAEFDGEGVDAQRLDRAVDALIARHPMLRVAFTDDGTQIVGPAAKRGLTVVDLRAHDADAIAARLEELRDTKSHQLMDVRNGQVIDVTLTLLPQGRNRIHVDVDMLAADAMSYRRVLDDLAAFYVSDTSDEAAAGLAPIGYTFREYLSNRTIDESTHLADRAWWHDKMLNLPDTPSLPFVAETERAEPNRSFRLAHTFDTAAKEALIAAARGRGITTAVALATVFAGSVARWSTQQRFLLNVPLFDRDPIHPDVDKVVGDFTNSLLIDADMRADESLAARARRLQNELHTSATHSSYVGLDVLRDLGRVRGGAVTPSVVFTSGLDLGEVFSERVSATFGKAVWIISQGPQVDLDAQIVEFDGGFLVNWDVRRDALPADVASVMFERFCETLDSLAAQPDTWDELVGGALPAAQREVRNRVNATVGARAALPPRTLHHSFFATAVESPDRVAAHTAAGDELTYRQLADQALALAGDLAAEGVSPGDTVGIIAPKGVNQLSSVLAILAAGGHYLPISVDQPEVRRGRILQRGNVSVVISDQGPTVDRATTVIDPTPHARRASPLAGPVDTSPDSLAYVLFTSGSTGEPKGVEVSHRAAANTIDAINAEFGIGADSRTLAVSALDFDLSVFDVFSPLSVGGAIAVVDEAARRDAIAWAELVEKAGVTVINAAPGLIGMLVESASASQLATVATVITGGDRVPTQLAQQWRTLVPSVRFAGLGGTTETAIHSTICEVTDDFDPTETAVGYGTPLAGVQCRVVNASGQDCPDWVIGELWIGGASVAQGYRNDQERTADRFVTVDDVRWYRTGDLARYRPDGSLDFFGRSDHQVKVRGHRIELGEVESALMGLAGITAAVVSVTQAGHLGATVAGTADDEVIRTHLSQHLPAYMIPDRIVILDAMPLTANGKLDRAAVGRLHQAGDAVEYVAPATALETAIEYITGQVLGQPNLGVTTDFFDAGGDSILATSLTARLRGLLALQQFRVSDVFAGRTVRAIADRLSKADDAVRVEQVAQIFLEVAGVQVAGAQQS